MSSRQQFFTSARGRLLIFNLLVVAVTLMVSGVAVLGFRHASQIQEQVQQQTLDDMTGSMNLARDTANVAETDADGAAPLAGSTCRCAAGAAGAGAGGANYSQE